MMNYEWLRCENSLGKNWRISGVSSAVAPYLIRNLRLAGRSYWATCTIRKSYVTCVRSGMYVLRSVWSSAGD